jgi:hypothetical protein
MLLRNKNFHKKAGARRTTKKQQPQNHPELLGADVHEMGK